MDQLGLTQVVFRTGSPALGIPVLDVARQPAPPRSRLDRLLTALRRLWRLATRSLWRVS